MAKKQRPKIKKDMSLAKDYISTDYPPPATDVPIPVRGGMRIKQAVDIEIDTMLSSESRTKRS